MLIATCSLDGDLSASSCINKKRKKAFNSCNQDLAMYYVLATVQCKCTDTA